MRALLLALLALGLTLPACGGGAVSATTTTAGGDTTTTVPGTTTATVPETTTTTEAGLTAVTIYLLMSGEEGGPYLVPVYREIEPTVAVARAAMEALLAGPTGDEAAGVPSLSTAIPEGTELRGVGVEDGLATVDLSRTYESGGGSLSVMARLAQVVYTLTQFPTVEEVSFSLDGQPVEVFSSEGLVIEGPVGRADYLHLLPPVFVDQPAWGGTVDNPARLVGVARTDSFLVTIADWDGLILVEETVEVPAGGAFDVTIPYQIEEDQRGSLIVSTDGSVREHPVRLTSGR